MRFEIYIIKNEIVIDKFFLDDFPDLIKYKGDYYALYRVNIHLDKPIRYNYVDKILEIL